MEIDQRHDHSFRIPRPDQSIVYSTPNACTGCHQDKSNAWAATAIDHWYGDERKYHFSDDLLPGSLLNDKSEGHLVKLLGDTLQPEMARAAVAYYLGKIQTPGSVRALQAAVGDKKPFVRYHAARAMENFPEEEWKDMAVPLLRDKVRAVRIAGADLLHRLRQASIPTGAEEFYTTADAENRQFLLYQTDFSIGNVMMADYELQAGRYVSAIDYYQKGLKKDNQMNYARFNLASAYNSIGKNEDALKTLQDAIQIDRANERAYYNLGLLYYEMKEEDLAIEHFQKAMELKSVNPGLYYNYGLLLQQQGKKKQAEGVFLQGIKLQPQAINLNYALAFFYLSEGLPQKARPFAQVLHLADPQNPDYQAMFHDLGIIH